MNVPHYFSSTGKTGLYRTIGYNDSSELCFGYLRDWALKLFKLSFPGVVDYHSDLCLTYTDIEGDKSVIVEQSDLDLAIAMYDKNMPLKIMYEPLPEEEKEVPSVSLEGKCSSMSMSGSAAGLTPYPARAYEKKK
jgi:hypothetical protein